MKENSIEEALKKLSTGKKIKIDKLLRTFKREGIENFVTTRKKYVDVILSDYKKLQKENEELKNQEATARRINKLLVQRYSNSIPVQKVKDNIEKLKAQYKTALEKNSTEAFILKCQITILQELIKESEE